MFSVKSMYVCVCVLYAYERKRVEKTDRQGLGLL